MNRELKQILLSKYVRNNIIYYGCLFYFPVPTTIYTIVRKFI